MKTRLDQALVQKGLVPTRSQAESFIKLAEVKVNGQVVTKPGALVKPEDKMELMVKAQYVNRAALKLVSVARELTLEFKGKTVLDIGSSTGGFTDYALQHGAKRVIAVDVGTGQMHPRLRQNPRVELHEKTDIRQFNTTQNIDVALIDVSFISLREVLPSVTRLAGDQTQIVAMVKPQFEAGQDSLKHKGIIKNDRMRRDILKNFETWASQHFVIQSKADSAIAGSKGNLERFYLLRKLPAQ